MEMFSQERNLIADWGADLEVVVCQNCDWRFLVSRAERLQGCPHCFQAPLTSLTDQVSELPYLKPPEAVVPFLLQKTSVSQGLERFAREIWFPPDDLRMENLQARLRKLFLPVWLVDAEVTAYWRAEAGFDYQVVSYQDHYDDVRQGWVSRQVIETRVRWEPRVGRLRRTYHNLTAPALEENQNLKPILAGYDLRKAETYRYEALQEGSVCLPERAPSDAWNDVKPALHGLASEECRIAVEAQHLRQFEWQPEIVRQNWTLLLLPVYTTFYLDDDHHPQPILINAQNGKMSGSRRASIKRAQRLSLSLLAIAAVILLVALVLAAIGMAFPALLIVGLLGIVLGLIIAFGAVIPLGVVWWFNQANSSRRPE